MVVSKGVSSGRDAPTTNLDAPTRNLQSIKNKHTEQPTKKKRATPYRIHMLPLLNRRGWKQLIFKNVCINNIFCAVL